VKLILDKNTYQTVAMKIIDPGGNLEVVYTFSRTKLNQRPKGDDPLMPDLDGYEIFRLK